MLTTAKLGSFGTTMMGAGTLFFPPEGAHKVPGGKISFRVTAAYGLRLACRQQKL